MESILVFIPLPANKYSFNYNVYAVVKGERKEAIFHAGEGLSNWRRMVMIFARLQTSENCLFFATRQNGQSWTEISTGINLL